jgi:hypothetical protein
VTKGTGRCVTAHRFPSWTVEELAACFVIKDDAGQKLAYVYFEEEPESALSSGHGEVPARRIGSYVAP